MLERVKFEEKLGQTLRQLTF